MSGPVVEPPVVKGAKAISCPNCGGAVELRGFAHTRTAVCIQCLSLIDTSSPELQILSRFDEKMRVRPVLALGTRGKFGGIAFEVIGFQVRTTWSDGLAYSWHEYLLFNPYEGFRYLTLYNGHWNFVRALPGVPAPGTQSGRPTATTGGLTYRHYQHGEATTTFVMGEFPWAVQAGEQVVFDDFIAPPHVLSREASAGEINWSGGEYMSGADVWKAFGLSGDPPRADGISPNQPSPYPQKVRHLWSDFFKLALAWLAVLLFFNLISTGKEYLSETVRMTPEADSAAPAVFTGAFDLKEVESGLTVEIKTLDSDSPALQASFVDRASSRTVPAALVEQGQKSQGWRDQYRSGTLQPGTWAVRLEPEAQEEKRSGVYEIKVRREAKGAGWVWFALIFLLIPPVLTSLRASSFESQRWSESDYGGGA
ncbi:MAG: DUF4178 domain-containing protein [Bryobacteraceae bacterium]|nr:DUF4178 domain-containing protein [Bryobacteraceae bacterium]